MTKSYYHGDLQTTLSDIAELHSYWSAAAHSSSALLLEYCADAFDEQNGHQPSIVDECNEIPIWIYDQSAAKWVDFFTYLKLAWLPVCNDTILITKIDQVLKKKNCSTNLYKNETLRAFSG